MGNLLSDPVPRIQAHAAACLSNFFEGSTKNQMKKYVEIILVKFGEML